MFHHVHGAGEPDWRSVHGPESRRTGQTPHDLVIVQAVMLGGRRGVGPRGSRRPARLRLTPAGRGRAAACPSTKERTKADPTRVGIVGATVTPGGSARSDPSVRYARDLIAQGYVGEVLTANLRVMSQAVLERGPGRIWQAVRANGANPLTIAGGHEIDALCYILGEVVEVSARVTTRITEWRDEETGAGVPAPPDDETLMILFTAGSSGPPKGVVLSYGNVGHNLDAIDEVFRLRRDRVLPPGLRQFAAQLAGRGRRGAARRYGGSPCSGSGGSGARPRDQRHARPGRSGPDRGARRQRDAGLLRAPGTDSRGLREGWYTTGDIGRVDQDGFSVLTDRAIRISKIGGEMVPHAQIEEVLARRLGSDEDEEPCVAVTAVLDARKGERLVVLYVGTESPAALARHLRAEGLPALMIPSPDSMLRVDAIPMLAAGKLDLKAGRDLAEGRLGVTLSG